MKVVFYSNASGKSPVLENINELGKEDQARLFGCLKNIEELGFYSPRVEFRQIEGKLWEIKIRLQSCGYRVFYVTIKKDMLVLLHAFKKQSQKTPDKIIKTAMKRLKEVIENETYYLK
jgi:phage-related protein